MDGKFSSLKLKLYLFSSNIETTGPVTADHQREEGLEFDRTDNLHLRYDDWKESLRW